MTPKNSIRTIVTDSRIPNPNPDDDSPICRSLKREQERLIRTLRAQIDLFGLLPRFQPHFNDLIIPVQSTALSLFFMNLSASHCSKVVDVKQSWNFSTLY